MDVSIHGIKSVTMKRKIFHKDMGNKQFTCLTLTISSKDREDEINIFSDDIDIKIEEVFE